MARGRRALGRDNEGGAALVEMALILPLLLLLLIGMIESGWAFSNQLDVRHAAREGARLAAVDAGDSAALVAGTCARMKATLATNSTVALGGGGGDLGDDAVITIAATHTTLSGLLDAIFGGIIFTEPVIFRLEQDASWSTVGATACP